MACILSCWYSYRKVFTGFEFATFTPISLALKMAHNKTCFLFENPFKLHEILYKRHFPLSLDVLSSLSVCCFSIWGKAESGHFCTHWKVEIGAKSGRVAAKTKQWWGHNKSTAGQSMACCSAAQNAGNSMEGGRWPNGTKHFFLGDVSPLHSLPE